MKNVLLGQVPGSDKFGPAPVETKRPIDQPPFPGGGAEADSGAPSGGGGAKVGDKNTIVETELGEGPDVGSRVDTRTKQEGDEAEQYRRKYQKQEFDTTPPTDDTEEEAPAINNTLLIAGGLALLFFLFKRKK